MAVGRSIGTVFVELDLDPSRYTKGQQRLLKDATQVSLNIEENFKKLGIKSSAEMDLMRQKIINSYNMIANSSKATTNDIMRAEKAKNDQLESLNKKQFGEQQRITEEVGKTISVFKQMFSAIALGTIAANAFMSAMRSLVVEFKVLVQYSARVEEIGIVVQNVGKQAGYSAGTISYYVDAVKKMGITSEDATLAITKLIQNELNLAEATGLARMAQDAATIAGIDSSEALNRMIHGIVTLQPEVLRHMGIMVNLESEYSKFAKTNDRTTISLTSWEKQQIALNAVLTQAPKIAGNYEAAMETASKQVRSFDRYIKDVYESLGKLTLPIYTGMVFGLAEAFKDARRWLEEHKTELEEWSKRIVQATTDLKGLIIELKNLAGLAEPLRNLGSAIKDSLFNQDLLNTMKSMYKTLESLAHGFNMFWYGAQGNFKRVREEWELAKKAWMEADALASKTFLIQPTGMPGPKIPGQIPSIDVGAQAAAEAARKQKELADKAAKERGAELAKAAEKLREQMLAEDVKVAEREYKLWQESEKAWEDYNKAIFEATATQYEKDMKAADDWLQAQRDRLNVATDNLKEYETELIKAEAAAEDMLGVAHYEDMIRQIEEATEKVEKLRAAEQSAITYQLGRLELEKEAAGILTKKIELSIMQQQLAWYEKLLASQKAAVTGLKDTDAAYWQIHESITRTQEKIIQITEAQRKLQATFTVGMQEGLKEYLRSLEDTFGQGFAFMKNITTSMESAFVSFFDYTSDQFLKFGDLAKKVLHEIYMELMRTFIVKPIVGWASELAVIGLGAGLGGSISPMGPATAIGHQGGLIMHTGGLIPLSPRYHSGLAPDERMAILQTGERVLSRKQNREYEKGGMTINIPISADIGNKRMISELRMEITDTVIQVMRRHA